MGCICADAAEERAVARNVLTAVTVVLVVATLLVPWKYPIIPYVASGLAVVVVVLLWIVPFIAARPKATQLI